MASVALTTSVWPCRSWVRNSRRSSEIRPAAASSAISAVTCGATRVTRAPQRHRSSAASAANGLVGHVRDLAKATPDGEWRSVCVKSDGSYGVTEGLISSFPVRADGQGGREIVQGLEQNDFLREKIAATVQELETERELVADLLG